MKLNHFITSQKILTFAYVVILMARFNQWQNITAWVYLSLHGTYGFLWALKSHIFPDKNWERKTSLWYGLVSWAALSLYWITPWIITSKGVQVQGLYLAVCISMYTFGVFLHFSADMQKYTALKLTPGYLITDGLLARSRNINYFGELLIYLGFGLLARHWMPLFVILLFILFVWIPNIIRKEKSLARYPDFEDYKRKSNLFIPFLF